MNLTYTRPGELRKPDVEVLPDGRIRITRYIAAGHGDRDYSEVTESVGTADKGLATALLVKRGMAQINGKDAIVKTYEVRNASSETLVGLPDVQYTESGQKTMVYDYIQMSSGTYTPGTIGSTQAPDDATCILRTEQTEDDGTTRQIRRVFINKGLLQQVDETKNNGALLLKTFVYLNDAPVPNPPTGYTLISQRTENPNGLETTTYVYAKGDGQISQDDTTSNNGALLRRTIRHITAPSAVNPIATPSGYTLVEQAYQDSDGHRIWTASYAKGTGEIAREIDYNNSGDQGTTGITRTTIRYLVVPSATVQPTTLAGSVEVGRSFQDADGHRIWTTTWAKGTGQISYEARYSQSTDQGTTGVTVITIRHLTAISVNVNPITTPAGTALISEEKSDNDGYRIWTAIYAKGTGTVSSTTDTREGGKLIIYRKSSIGVAPTAPTATIGGTVTLINDSSRNESGFVVYERAWAEGIGEISRDTRYLQSTDQGTTGATVISIRHITAGSVTVNPISTPSGTVLVSLETNEQDGYKLWAATYAKGAGTVISSTDTREGSKLIIYKKVGLGSAPSAPAATIGGTVTLISDSSRNDSGYVVYERTWAEGIGEISRDTRYSQSTDQGTTGATVITIRHITAGSVTSNPISTPSGTVLISVDFNEQDGYKVWTASYAKGAGTVVNSVDTREGGKLIIYRKIGLGSAPSAPAATISGTVTLISDSSRNDSGYVVYERTWAEGLGEVNRDTRYIQSSDLGTTGATVITIRYLSALSVASNPITTPAGTVLVNETKDSQDGYTVWNAVYAKGTGTVVTDVDIRNSGKLKIHHRVALGSAPSTPSVTIAGATMNVVSQNQRNDSGYVVYDYTWAEGLGIVAERIQYRDGGLRLLNRDIFLAQSATDYSAYTPTYGIEVDKSFTEGEGIRRYSVTWIQSNSGGDPLTNPVLQFTSKVPFTYPGRAKAYYIPFTVGTYTSHRAYDVFLSPPVQCLIDATTIVYYKSTNTAPTPSVGYTLWNPTDWAVMQAKWIGWSDSPRSKVEGLRGYIAVNSSVSGSSTSATDRSVFGDRVYASTSFEITLSGGPSDPGGTNKTLSIEQVPAFTKTDGTQYYRVTEVYATIPTQPALPTLLT